MPIDLVKEASEFITFIATDESAQLVILVSLIGAAVTAIVTIAFQYIESRQA